MPYFFRLWQTFSWWRGRGVETIGKAKWHEQRVNFPPEQKTSLTEARIVLSLQISSNKGRLFVGCHLPRIKKKSRTWKIRNTFPFLSLQNCCSLHLHILSSFIFKRGLICPPERWLFLELLTLLGPRSLQVLQEPVFFFICSFPHFVAWEPLESLVHIEHAFEM